MAMTEIILIVGISLSILLFILSFVFFIQFISLKKEVKKTFKSRPKDRRKRKRWKKTLHSLENKKSKKIRGFIFTLIAAIFIGGGTGYVKYFVSTNISEADTDNIVYGYFLLNEMEEQIKEIDKKSEKKASQNIHVIAVSISSFSSKKGSDQGVEESQFLLNQYYSKLGQLGLNMSTQDIGELKNKKDIQEEYLADINTVKISQKKVIDYYKIDEASLKQKK